jgi:1L-myo-inositol 1-phosphate cytidylyltransferase
VLEIDALIIAAGFGSRLRDVSDSKPMTPVAGVPLLELGVRQAKAAGVDRVVIVTGHEADKVEAALPALCERTEIGIVAQRVADWSKPNGWSVLAGAEAIDGDYLLMMSDHIFSGSILAGLARQGGIDRGVTLAVDARCTNPLVDPEDATWVERDEHGFIRSIGKTIESYDAVDCGAFLCTSELADAIRAAIDSGMAGSLSEGMQRLADIGRAATWEIGGAWWLDVDDPRAHQLAEEQAPQELAEIYAAALR